MSQDALVGTTINGYQLEKVIGHGGFSTIYRALHIESNNPVAIKVIHSLQHSEQIEHEARILSKLNHRHIIPVYDFFRDSERAYLVMKLLTGGSLRQHMDRKNLSVKQILYSVKYLASALEYIHSQGYIHRDIKPDNILFDCYGNVFIADFGIAYDISKKPEGATSADLVGSPNYIPPEQLRHIYAPNGDVYSLGIMLFELLAHELPFRSSSVLDVLRQHLRDDIPTLPESLNLPPELNIILKKATAKSPQDRYSSALEMLTDLESVIYYYRSELVVDTKMFSFADPQYAVAM